MNHLESTYRAVGGEQLLNRADHLIRKKEEVVLTSSQTKALQIFLGRKSFSQEERTLLRNEIQSMGKTSGKVLGVSTLIGAAAGGILGGPLAPFTAPAGVVVADLIAAGPLMGIYGSKSKQFVRDNLEESAQYNKWLFQELLTLQKDLINEVLFDYDILHNVTDMVQEKIAEEPQKLTPHQELSRESIREAGLQILTHLHQNYQKRETSRENFLDFFEIFSPQEQQQIFELSAGDRWNEIEGIQGATPRDKLSRQLDVFIGNRPNRFREIVDLQTSVGISILVSHLTANYQKKEDQFARPFLNFLRNCTCFDEEEIRTVFHQLVFETRFLAGAVYSRATVENEFHRPSRYQMQINRSQVSDYPEMKLEYLKKASVVLQTMAQNGSEQENKRLLALDSGIRKQSKKLYFGQLRSHAHKREEREFTRDECHNQGPVAWWESCYGAYENSN